jgi:hypothetical protein
MTKKWFWFNTFFAFANLYLVTLGGAWAAVNMLVSVLNFLAASVIFTSLRGKVF